MLATWELTWPHRALEFARQTFSETGADIDLRVGDLMEAIENGDESFDVILVPSRFTISATTTNAVSYAPPGLDFAQVANSC